MSELWASFLGSGIWAVIKAFLLLILALIVANIVKGIVVKLLAKVKLPKALESADPEDGSKEAVVDFIGKLVQLFVFLLFVPGIFQSLGMDNVSSPILNLLDTIWGYVPNILAAALVLWIGFFVAKLVRELLIPVFAKLNVNSLQEKAGIEVKAGADLAHTIAYIIYVLILIPVIIAAFQVLNIKAISEPAIEMLNTIFGFIPNIFAALIILVIGFMIAKFSAGIVERMIAASGLDAKVSEHVELKSGSFVLSSIVGKIVYAVIAIFFLVESFGVLKLDVLTHIGSAIIGYLPYVLAAALIFAGCYFCAGLAQKALAKNGHPALAFIAKAAIYTVGAFMMLNELGIASEIVNSAFVLMVAAVAVAFALSFGLGGREFAQDALKKLESACAKESDSENKE